MNMSFSEKSAWISLVIIFYIWGDYALGLVGLHNSAIDMEDKKSLALQMINIAIIAVIIVESVFHAVLAMAHPKPSEQAGDERDKLISLKATSPAYAVLFTAVVLGIGHLLIIEQFEQFAEGSSLNIPFIGVHILLFGALIAEIVRFAMMIKEYRLGV
ncbi:hypothetical protein [Alteromonas facilis]|uniref:hypothetical protein n=1 Tax=Alteromonas facilis TaxID=2048004 RepID=UPI000C294DB6|nr:hypothetical protein [Alteromonas facilis]